MTPDPILVTGATGHVGRAVCTTLLRAGAPVRAALTAGGGRPPELDGVEIVPFDFWAPDGFAAAVRGCSGLFLLRPPAISKVGPTLNRLVDVARAAGVRQVTFLSVAGAERNRIVPHHRVERHLTASGRGGWTILRPGFFAQNLTSAYREDIRGGRIVLPAGSARVAFVDARDLGEVAALTLLEPRAHERAAYHLTGPRAWSFDEVARLLATVLERPVRYEPIGALRYARHLHGQGLPPAQIAVQTILHLGLRRGDAEPADPTLGRLLGRAPTDLPTFVRDHRSAWEDGTGADPR